MHQTVGNGLRALEIMNPPDGVESAERMIDTALSNCLYATQAALHGTLKGSPGSLAFGRDMVLDIPVIADWNLIRQRRQQSIDQRLIEANNRRFSYDYQPGEQVLKISYKPNKLQPRAEGPYQIATVLTNGTVTIRLTPHVVERISIQRIKPFRSA